LAPLELIAVAATLPRPGSSLVDRNVRFETEADWAWADLVIISLHGMIVQKPGMLHLIHLVATARQKKWQRVGPTSPRS